MSPLMLALLVTLVAVGSWFSGWAMAWWWITRRTQARLVGGDDIEQHTKVELEVEL